MMEKKEDRGLLSAELSLLRDVADSPGILLASLEYHYITNARNFLVCV